MRRAHSLALAGCIAIAACGTESTVPAGPAPIAIVGKWRMKSFDARPVPGTYAEFFDEVVGDRIVRYTEIRLDSALKELRADSLYERHYYFTEHQDGVVAARYSWGDHGKFSIGGPTSPAAIRLTSEYIQNLSAAGRVSATGDIELDETLWLGEEPRSTVWAKQ